MAADIATLGLRVDSDGAVLKVRSFYGALKELGVNANQVESKLKTLGVNTAITFSSMASGANRDITSVLRQLSSLGFAFGAGAGVATTAIASIATAWAETREQSKREHEQMLADLQRFVQRYTLEGKKIALARMQRQESELSNRYEMVSSNPESPMNFYSFRQLGEMNALGKQLETVRRQIGLLAADIAGEGRASAAAAAKKFGEEMTKAARLAREELEKTWRAEIEFREALQKAATIYAKKLADVHDEWKRLTRMDFVPFGPEWTRQIESGVESAIEAVRRFDAEQKKIEERQKAARGMMLGVLAGGLSGAGGIAGAVGSGLSGAIGGIAGGTLGIAAGGFMGLTQGILGMLEASEAAREEMRRWVQSYQAFIDTVRTQLGDMSEVEKSIADVRREFDNMRRAAAEMAVKNGDVKKNVEALQVELARLNELERRRIEQIRDEAAAREREFANDLVVRLARAQGRTEEAALMALLIQQEKEMREAREAGMDATTLAMLAEVQRAEKQVLINQQLDAAIAKVQGRIDSFAATIEGLEGFRDALLLSDTVSPTEKYAEAARQYQAIVEKALTGDQGAAARLPAAAQAFLDASREVNASGSAFQADFLKVLADTQAAIDKFGELKSIEEQMLEELKAIRDHTKPREWGDAIPLDPNKPRLPTVDEAAVTVSQAGFQATTELLRSVVSRLDSLERSTIRVGDSIIANRSLN